MNDDLLRRIKDLEQRIADLETLEFSKLQFQILIHTTGDAWSTVSSRSSSDDGLIDLSATFGTPANIKAVILRVDINDGDTTSPVAQVGFGDDSGASDQIMYADPAYNSEWMIYNSVIVPCDSNGDIYIAFSETVDQFRFFVIGWVI